MSAQPFLRIFGGYEDSGDTEQSDFGDGFWRPNHASQATGDLTLDQFFETRVRDRLRALKRSPATIREYAAAVRCWRAFWSERMMRDTRIRYPCVKNIRQNSLADFQAWLLANGHGERTVNKHVLHVQAILRRCEDVGRVPSVESIPTRRAAPNLYLDREQVSAIYEACMVATWPRTGCGGDGAPLFSAATAWQVAIVLYVNFGFRTQELISFSAGCRGLQWDSFSAQATSPAVGGKAVNEHGWLTYTPQKQSRSKPDPLILPVSKHVRRHLARIGFSTLAGQSRPLFDFPRSARDFYRQWRAIVKAAGIQPVKIPGQPSRHITPKHFRQTAETWLDELDPGVGPLIVGHAPRNVAYRHYIASEARVLKALTTLEQPQAFLT